MDITEWQLLKETLKNGILCKPISYYRNPSILCTYMNIKMILSSNEMETSVSDIKQAITKMWNRGFDPLGREQLHPLLNQFIGSTELCVFFKSLNMKCVLYDFHCFTYYDKQLHPWFKHITSTRLENSKHMSMMQFILEYYTDQSSLNKIYQPSIVVEKEPLHLQYQGHCILIVGVEFLEDNILILIIDSSSKQYLKLTIDKFTKKQYSIVRVICNQQDDGQKNLYSIRIP